jgi:glucose-1-phosphate thymidylyltransferase
LLKCKNYRFFKNKTALNQNNISSSEVIAVIPAAGKATRLSPLPCSKELIPIGFGAIGQENQLRPKVVSHYLLEMFKLAGIKKAYIVLNSGKLDIPAYFGSGQMVDMKLAYLLVDLPIAVPYTLDQAYPFVQNKLVALGFPDIVLHPENSFVQLLAREMKTKADIVLGLYPTDQPHKMDVVDLDENGCIRQIRPKPLKLKGANVNYAWLTAVWTPVFTQYLHEFVSEHKKKYFDDYFETAVKNKRELFVGDIFQAALADRLTIETVLFSDGNCLDIGTPDDLAKAVGKSALG